MKPRTPEEIVRISNENAERVRIYREFNLLLGNFTRAVHEDMAKPEPKKKWWKRRER